MRIRKKYNPILFIAALFLFFGLALMTTEISASTLKNKTKWQMGKSIVISQKDVQYHVYLSKNKKESWIYKIELKKKIRKLVIPKKINHASVTRIGYGMELYGDDDDCYYSVFGDVLEPWHECYGEESKKKNAIVEIVFPKTLKQIEAGSFSGMKRLKKARIPDKVEMIPCFSFSACPSLKSVVLPGKMNGIDNYAFAESSNISTLFIKNNCKKYTVENGILIDKLKNKMVWVVSAKKTVVIPSTVTGIADYAFLASQANTVMIPKSIKKIGKKALTATKIQNVSLEADNAKYEMQDNCIYTKDEGMLIAVLVTGQKIQISDKIKIMGENVSVMGGMDEEGQFSVHIPSSVGKVIEDWMFFGNADVYFYSMKPPVIESKYKGYEYTALPIFNKVYVPKAAKKTYIQWAKDRDGLTWDDLHVF